MGLFDSIVDSFAGGKSALDDLLVAANKPGFNTPGAGLRFIRGGVGDAVLNTDQPDPRLVQQQFLPIRRDLLNQQFSPNGQFDSSQLLNLMLQGQRGFLNRVKPKTFAEFILNPKTHRLEGSRSVPIQ